MFLYNAVRVKYLLNGERDETMEQEEHLERASEIHRPAKLPEHSPAAAAQRLNDVPGERPRGVYYEAAHRKVHPDSWHILRHLKRKHVELSNMHNAGVDRAGR